MENTMDFSEVCRLCLGNKLLTPIFPKSVDHKCYSMTIFVTTGIKVHENDGLPQQMCAHCVYNLNNSLKFRKRCKDTEIKLLQVKHESNNRAIKVEVTDDSTTNEDYTESREDVKLELKCEVEDTVIQKQDIPTPTDVPEREHDADDELDEKVDNTKDQDDPLYQARILDNNKKPKTRVTCPLCHKDLSVRSLSVHMLKMHPGTDRRREQCKLCDRHIVRDKMNQHMILKHGSKNFKCRYCATMFENHTLLLEHVTQCTIKKNITKGNRTRSREVVECDVCHKKMQRASLRIHVRIKHAGLGPVCEHCGRRFGNKLRLEDHLRAFHGGDRFKCSYCDFTSANKTLLANHERRHRGEKPFVCETCGAKFHAPHLLVQHRQSHRTERDIKNHERRHRGEKPFVCETCGAKFHAPHLLVQHRQSHRTERDIKCGLCGAAFRSSGGLQAHRASRHAAGARCGLCARAYACRHYAVKHMRAVHGFKGPVPALQVVKKSSET